MRIINIKITEFGGLSDVNLDFCDGLNIIEGLNESGKSTVNAFIKFMLYGLDNTRHGDLSIAERKQFVSWKNGLAQGSMTLEHDGRVYRIERRGQLAASYRDTCVVYDITTNERVFKGRDPGEIFLGIAAPVYESTCCIRQRELSDVDGKGVSDAIQNMLVSADRDINLDRSKKKLLDARKSLLLQKGSGGRIAELEHETELLKARLEKAEKAASELRSRRESAERKKQLSVQLRNDLNTIQARIKAYEEYITLGRFDELHGVEKKIDEIKQSIEQLKQNYSSGGFIPDRDYYGSLCDIERKIPTLLADYERAELSLERTNNMPEPDPVLCQAAQQTQAAGGEAAVVGVFRNMMRSASIKLRIAIILTVLAVLMGGAGVFLGLNVSTVLFAIAGGGLILLIVGIILFSSRGKSIRAIDRYLESAGYFSTKIPDIYTLTDYINECAKAKKKAEDRDRLLKLAESFLNEKLREVESALDEAATMLIPYGENTAPTIGNAAILLDSVKDTIRSVLEFCSKHEELCKELAIQNGIAQNIAASLSRENESLLRNHITPKMAEEFGKESREQLFLKRDYTQAQLSASEKARTEADRRLIELESSVEDPLLLSSQLDAKENELRRLKTALKAVILASETLDTAADELRMSVTPRLCEGASNHMSLITNGKYNSLSVDSNVDLSVITDFTRSIDVLSCGTRDAAYLSLRFAMIDMLFRDDRPVITIDEGLSQFDDNRARSMLCILANYCDEGGQCILFTCHSRESKMLEQMAAHHKKLTLRDPAAAV